MPIRKKILVVLKGYPRLSETFIAQEEQPASGLGGKPHRGVPDKPLKRQKNRNCDISSGEVLINGGCWYGGRDPGGQPCGPLEFEHNGRCYRPVPEDAEKPVSVEGLFPKAPDGGVRDGGFEDGGR